ncbi:MAG TPA: DUF4142 domain-containing protein [Candidatus Binatia bacterium]|nr:DUF4142 domain-containing protein [Candidatus Binatia bacterium]
MNTHLHLTHPNFRSLLFASAALAVTAVAVAGCNGNYNPHYKQGSASSTHTTSTVAATPTLAPAGTATVVAPATAVVPNTVVTNTVAPGTVLVAPSGTVGGTVVVPANQVPVSQVVGADVDFMARASEFNATEIAMSEVAAQRAQSDDVREFARETIDAHRRMSSELGGIAARDNVSLAFQPNPAGSTAVSRISALNGRDLDRAYLDQIIADHQAASAMYGMESDSATDVTLRSTAGGDAVDLRNRLDQAQRLREDID